MRRAPGALVYGHGPRHDVPHGPTPEIVLRRSPGVVLGAILEVREGQAVVWRCQSEADLLVERVRELEMLAQDRNSSGGDCLDGLEAVHASDCVDRRSERVSLVYIS